MVALCVCDARVVIKRSHHARRLALERHVRLGCGLVNVDQCVRHASDPLSSCIIFEATNLTIEAFARWRSYL